MGKENKYITIKNPCNLNWSSLSGKGSERFCHKCQYSVHDLTSQSNSQIVNLVMTGKGNKVCGRVSQSQVKRSVIHTLSKNGSIQACLVFLLGLSTISASPAADHDNPKLEVSLQSEEYRNSFENKPNLIKQDSVRSYRGRVMGSDDYKPLPAVKVGIRGSDMETKTDSTGAFLINVDKIKFRKTKPVLVFSYLGYITKEIELTREDREIEIQLAPEIMWIGEVQVPWYHRLWWVLKSPFI